MAFELSCMLEHTKNDKSSILNVVSIILSVYFCSSSLFFILKYESTSFCISFAFIKHSMPFNSLYLDDKYFLTENYIHQNHFILFFKFAAISCCCHLFIRWKQTKSKRLKCEFHYFVVGSQPFHHIKYQDLHKIAQQQQQPILWSYNQFKIDCNIKYNRFQSFSS